MGEKSTLSLFCALTNGFDYRKIVCWHKFDNKLRNFLQGQHSLLPNNGANNLGANTVMLKSSKTHINLSIEGLVTEAAEEALFSLLPGNLIYVFFAVIGLFGNSMILYVYATRRRFHYRSYYLFAALAFADLISCFGFLLLGAFRAHRHFFFHSVWKPIPAEHCMLILMPLALGCLLSISMDFVVSADRLFSIIRPIYHTLNLSNRYAFMLIGVAYLRGILEFSFYFNGMGETVPVCTLQDPRERNCILLASDMVSIVLICGTITNYLLTVPAARVQAKAHIRDVQSLFGKTKMVVAKLLRMERVIFKSATAIAVTFFVTSLATYCTSEALECFHPGENDGLTSYIFTFMELDTIDTFFISMFFDLKFRAEVKNVLKYWPLTIRRHWRCMMGYVDYDVKDSQSGDNLSVSTLEVTPSMLRRYSSSSCGSPIARDYPNLDVRYVFNYLH